MVTRCPGRRFIQQSPVTRRRRPDWDNSVNDLKMLRLSPTELEAKSRAFKSKDWSRPGSVASTGHRLAPSEAKLIKTKAPRGKQFSSDDEDYEEDIRRLESLQMQEHHRQPAQQFVRGSPNLLHYLETEMQKACSEMVTTKKKRAPKLPQARRRLKVHLGHRKTFSTNELRVLNTVLNSSLSSNQSFVQELQKHVHYQQQVIQELNNFRISATKELTNLVDLVQKLLSIKEAKSSVVRKLPECEAQREKITAKVSQSENTKEDPTSIPPKLEKPGLPPKPREVPGFLKRRGNTPQLQPTREASTNTEARSQAERPAENKKRHPSTLLAKSVTEELRESQVACEDFFDRRENPLFESEMHGKAMMICGGPCKKSRLQERPSSPKWRPGRAAKAGTEASERSEAARPGREQAPAPKSVPETRPAICLLVRKQPSEQDRFVSSRSRNAMESHEKLAELLRSRSSNPSGGARCNPQQEVPSKAQEGSRLNPEKIGGGPRYRLQGWSAAFLQAGKQTRTELKLRF